MDHLENDSLSAQIVRTFESVDHMAKAQQRFDEEVQREVARLWADNAELRDELHALANRVERLTQTLGSALGEADRIVASRRANG